MKKSDCTSAEHWQKQSPGLTPGKEKPWEVPALGQGWRRRPSRRVHSAVHAVFAADQHKQTSASPRPGLSLGSGKKAEREQLFCGSQEWAPETIPEDSGLKDNPQWG